MRLSALAVLMCLAAPLAHAQFQEPTKDELQMTADPKAPGAAAVYLYREERTDDTLHYQGLYVRMKVLTEKGKEAATVHVPYQHGAFKVTGIQGRTIHADGTVVPLTATPADLVDVKNKDYQFNTVVFTLPSVEVGSILEYRLQIRYDDQMASPPQWDVQQPYFVHKAHYFFYPTQHFALVNSRGEELTDLLYAMQGQMNSKVVKDASGRFTLDVTDVPAIPHEDWMLPLNSITWKVRFYYSAAVSGQQFWQDAGKRWAKDSDRFANASSAIRQAATETVAAADTDDVKAKKLYDAVQKLENTDFTRTKSDAERKAENLKQIKNADTVWVQKSGSGNDLALLYVALARAAGLKAYAMQVVDRNRAIFDGNYLYAEQLDDYIAVVNVGGKDEFVDPGQKMCPYGLLHWKHTLAGGLRESDAGPAFGATPGNSYMQNIVERIGDVTLHPDGSIGGTLRFVMKGQDALHWRQMALRNDPEEVKKQFTEWVRRVVPDGVQPEVDHFLAMDDYNSNFVAMVKITGGMGTATGKHVFEPGVFFESHSSNSFASEDKRLVPVDVHYAKRTIDQVTYRLPAGFTMESAPQPTSIPWQGNAVMHISTKAAPDAVVVTRDLAHNFTIVDEKDYGALHDFYQKVAAADQQQIALVRAPQAVSEGSSK